MAQGRIGRGSSGIVALSGVAVAASVACAGVLRPHVEPPVPIGDAPVGAARAIDADFMSEIPAKQEMFNKGLPVKVDQYTVLQRVDHKKGLWNFHFLVSYYITKVEEFEKKKHASTISNQCMDKSFVQSLKDSGPFLYEYLDPSGQTADVVIPKEDCGD